MHEPAIKIRLAYVKFYPWNITSPCHHIPWFCDAGS